MRGLRESLRLLARSNALLASLSPAAASGGGALAAAAAAAPASQAATVLQREAAALRRWVHCGGTPGPWRQQLVGQQQQWLARQPGAAAELQCLRRLSFGPRRAKDVMEGVAHKNKNSGWYYVSSGQRPCLVAYDVGCRFATSCLLPAHWAASCCWKNHAPVTKPQAGQGTSCFLPTHPCGCPPFCSWPPQWPWWA